MNTLLWVVYPYVAVAILVGGLVWRYRYDKFGWTTRSSQLYETTVLRWGSPLFHFGILLVLLGHIGGLLIPKSWTEAAGISEHMYHLAAVFLGTVAGFCTLIGMAILILRRRLTGPVFAATTKNDKAMYLVLASVIVLGLWATVKANLAGGGYDYRETVSPWFRSLFVLQPDPALMTNVPATFQTHVIAAFALFAFWPFTRLVHAFSAPVGYLTRPYVVYRSRDLAQGSRGLRAARPGWEGPPQAPGKRR
ncbi:respiratory nitrate reductase subunit gamma [Hamadaea sp. NPDC050747]|uniref:respiratory nitrate reductase subunit gamma n=1 Tax=Hamadaea sp. NPDC050747 TaxID=3155789 RepID=UPI003404F589